MANYSVFSAIAVPRTIADPLDYWDDAARKLRGHSRHGWFVRQCKELLDVAPSHDSLRFLSMEASTRERRENNDLTTWRLLNEKSLQNAVDELDSILGFARDDIEFLFGHLKFDAQGWTLDEIRTELSEALGQGDLPERVTDGGEGDTPKFMFIWLVAVRNFLSYARANSRDVVYLSWHGEWNGSVA